MLRRVLFILPLALLSWACSDDAQQTQEPVVPDATTAIPDSPGSGELVPTQPAGQGEVAPAPAPVAETTPQPAPAPVATTGKDMTVTVGGLNVRSGPGTKFKSVRVLRKGDKVSAQNCKKNWCQIGDKEYVSKKYVK